MFRPDHRVNPFNHISHIDGRTLGFALNLRSSSNGDENHHEDIVKSPRREHSPPKKVELEENRGRCEKLICHRINLEIYELDREKRDLLNKIESTQKEILEFEDYYTNLVGQLEKNKEYVEGLQTILNSFNDKIEYDLKTKKKDIAVTQYNLERKIQMVEHKLKRMKSRKMNRSPSKATTSEFSSHSSSYPRDELEINFSKGVESNRNKGMVNNKKHNGVFRMGEEGKMVWSCCKSEVYDDIGCIDDQSVGVKTSLEYIPISKNNSYFQVNSSSSWKYSSTPMDHTMKHISQSQMFSESNRESNKMPPFLTAHHSGSYFTERYTLENDPFAMGNHRDPKGGGTSKGKTFSKRRMMIKKPSTSTASLANELNYYDPYMSQKLKEHFPSGSTPTYQRVDHFEQNYNHHDGYQSHHEVLMTSNESNLRLMELDTHEVVDRNNGDNAYPEMKNYSQCAKVAASSIPTNHPLRPTSAPSVSIRALQLWSKKNYPLN